MISGTPSKAPDRGRALARRGVLSLTLAVLGAFGSAALAAPPTKQPSPQPPSTAAERPAAALTGDPAAAASRSRMLECGHQWSNMKHAGTASGTWKDFSRGCLAQR